MHKNETQEGYQMSIANKSLAVFLTNPEVRGIKACYETDQNGNPLDSKLYKTFDPDIKVGDLIVVPANTRLGFTTNKVVEVDVLPDFETRTEVNWIAGRADLSLYKSCQEQENEMLNKIRAAEQEEKRKALMESMKASLGGDLTAIGHIEAPAE